MNRERAVLSTVAVLLTGSHLIAMSAAELGDAEALYACYGMFVSSSYLDHPPLVGWLASAAFHLGGIHVYTVRAVSLAAMLLSLGLMFALCASLYGERAGAWGVVLLLGTPVFTVGTTALSPDSVLIPLVLLFAWQLKRTLDDDDRSRLARIWRPVLLGGLIGLAFLAKYTGVCLALSALVCSFTRRGRPWLRRPGYWLGAGFAAALSVPVIYWNAKHNWAGVLHRLVWTQGEAGLSFRNLGALVGGQLLYVGPLMIIVLSYAAYRAWRARLQSRAGSALLAVSAPILICTFALALWSRVAEPHWPAVGYLPLFAAAAGELAAGLGRMKKLARAAVLCGVVVWIALHIITLTPLLPRVAPEQLYVPKYDLANELIGWPEVARTVREMNPERRTVTAAFYTQCAQLTFHLRRVEDPPIRCVSPETDDFDIWHEKSPFRLGREGALFVTDNRFDFRPEQFIAGARVIGAPRPVEIVRGGRVVRRFLIYELTRF